MFGFLFMQCMYSNL